MPGVTANDTFQLHTRLSLKVFFNSRKVSPGPPSPPPFFPQPDYQLHVLGLPCPCARPSTEPVQLTNLTEYASFILSWGKTFGQVCFCANLVS